MRRWLLVAALLAVLLLLAVPTPDRGEAWNGSVRGSFSAHAAR